MPEIFRYLVRLKIGLLQFDASFVKRLFLWTTTRILNYIPNECLLLRWELLEDLGKCQIEEIPPKVLERPHRKGSNQVKTSPISRKVGGRPRRNADCRVPTQVLQSLIFVFPFVRPYLVL